MKNCFFRVDERLIHGQTAVAWHRRIESNVIIAVSDQAAEDEMKKTLLEMAAPAGVKMLILSANKVLEYFKEVHKLDDRCMVVFEKLEDVLFLVKNRVDISVVNIGGMYFKTNRRQYRKALFLSDEEIEILRELSSLGVALEYQVSPVNKKEDAIDIIK